MIGTQVLLTMVAASPYPCHTNTAHTNTANQIKLTQAPSTALGYQSSSLGTDIPHRFGTRRLRLQRLDMSGPKMLMMQQAKSMIGIGQARQC